MATQKFLTYGKLPGSEKQTPKGEKTDTINPNEVIDVTIIVRRKKSIVAALASNKLLKREEYDQEFGASEEDMGIVEEFANNHHLSIVEKNSARRSIILKGRILDFETAFKVYLSHYSDPKGNIFRGRTGHINIPSELNGIVEGVFGLDNRIQARPMHKPLTINGKFAAHADVPGSFYPSEVAAIYGFPKTAKPIVQQCIGIIELGGGFRNTDLADYFTQIGIPLPTVLAVSVDNGLNNPSTPDSDDGEVMLDIEVAGAVSPNSKIVVYFAPNTDQGFLDAITTAVHDTQNSPNIISISWGSAEVNWTEQSMNNLNSALQSAYLLGIPVCIASGDAGSSDGVNDGNVHVDFPASSPFALACGGTSLQVNNGTVTSESVWNDSSSSAGGGGVSEFFALPDFQNNIGVPLSASTNFKGRGVPDIAGNADPNTGYKVKIDGVDTVLGGTSAVAPLVAGLLSLINSQNGNFGRLPNSLYSQPTPNSLKLRGITQGNNITTSTNKGYNAGPGWNACAGWGVLS